MLKEEKEGQLLLLKLSMERANSLSPCPKETPQSKNPAPRHEGTHFLIITECQHFPKQEWLG